MAAISMPPPIQRYITTHDEATGKSIFAADVPTEMEFTMSSAGAGFVPNYVLREFPAHLQGEKDVSVYNEFKTAPALSLPDGVTVQTVAMPPGSSRPSPMHRTMTVDFGCVIEGEVELTLDSGEKRVLKKGDVIVQRETNHLWTNTSEENWLIFFFVLVAAKPLEVAGEVLSENFDGGKLNLLPESNPPKPELSL